MLVHGSAVLVAPGVAFAARHVIEPHLSSLAEGHATLSCGSITRSQLMMWQCKKITFVENNSDIAILILSYISDLPSDNLFRTEVDPVSGTTGAGLYIGSAAAPTS